MTTKHTYTAETTVDGQPVRATRTSHRIYTHAAVRGPYSDGTYGVTFHGSAAQAARKNEYGQCVKVVELTSDRGYNEAARATLHTAPAAPVAAEPVKTAPAETPAAPVRKTNKASTKAVIHNLSGWYETDMRKGSINTDEAWTHMGDNPEDFEANSRRYLSNYSNLRTVTLDSADWQAVWDHFQATEATETAPEQPVEHVSGALVGYGRVSTLDQNEALQTSALKAAGCIRIFTDKASGKSLANRPELDECLKFLRAGDTLCVWKLDRIARSVVDLINLIDGLTERGINFKVLTGALSGIDTRTPDGRLFLTIVGGMAEFERSLIRERTMAGLAEAREAGRVGGRPRAVDADKLAALKARVDRGESVTAAAKALGIGRATAYRELAALAETAAAN